MNNVIDITKPARTRDGRKVTELHIIAGKLVGNMDGQVHCWSLTGQSTLYWQSYDDIENFPKPEPKYVWINVYDIGQGCVGGEHQSRDAANLAAKAMAERSRVARLYILRLNVDTGETVKE